jgi:uncharacterized protein
MTDTPAGAERKKAQMQVRNYTGSRKRSYLDPVHQEIVLDRAIPCELLIIDLIDTPEFQRLRRIHQLGVSNFTYQGAEGSRFTHSVGVMFIARQLLDLLKDKTPEVEEDRALVLAAALLHDLGHGPYSHVSEKILKYEHEDWSCRIVDGNTEVNAILTAFNPQLPKAIKAILKKSYKPKYVTDLLSSQLDCDRFDYLLRDSYLTGTAYGLFGLHRILSSLEIDRASHRIVVAGEKGQAAVEDYLFARSSMYQQVYYHRKNLAARALLSRLLKRARLLADKICFIDSHTQRWLTGEPLDVKDYLFLDDVQMSYHIKRWAEDQDPVMKDLACRFLNRRLFNAIRMPFLNMQQVDATMAKAREIVASAGFDPEYYVAIEMTGLRPYDYYRPEANHPQTNIMVRTDRGEVKELSTISPTVEALVRGSFDTYWLIYPSEVREQIGAMIESEPR